MRDLELVTYTVEDAPQLQPLSAGVDWGHTVADWRTALEVGTFFGHRTQTGEIVSSAGCFQYGDKLASIGLVIVKKSFQGQGLGKFLMQQCLQSLQPATIPTMLIATEEGQPLYEKLGFVTIGAIHSFRANGPFSLNSAAHLANYTVTTMNEADFEEILQVDYQASGVDRSRLLQARSKQAEVRAILRGEGGKIEGFAFRVRQNKLLIIGPVIANNLEAATALVEYLNPKSGEPVRIDVPNNQPEFLELLTSNGFELRSSSPLMLLHAEELPGQRQNLFAIVAQAFG